MSQLKKYGQIGATFAVALGVGFVMQNGDALAARFGGQTAPTVTAQATTMPTSIQPASVIPIPYTRPDGEHEMETPVVDELIILARPSRPESIQAPRDPAAPLLLAAAEADQVTGLVEEAAPAAMEPACAPVLSAATAPGAMVELSLTAPCFPATAVTIHHQGMIFGAVTDADGLTNLSVPALSELAVFFADFGGFGAGASASVPDIAGFERAVLQWQGDANLGLHALENGAGYGTPGHVSAAAPGDVGRALSAEGGFLVRLGDAAAPQALFAEVYTFPGTGLSRAGVALNVEAAITEASCGRRVSAQTIQITPGEAIAARDLDMTLPGCAAAGEFLVLSNMLRDLTLAAR